MTILSFTHHNFTNKQDFEFGFAGREGPGEAIRFILVEHDTLHHHIPSIMAAAQRKKIPPYYTIAFNTKVLRPPFYMPSWATTDLRIPLPTTNHFTSTDFRFQHQPRGLRAFKGQGLDSVMSIRRWCFLLSFYHLFLLCLLV